MNLPFSEELDIARFSRLFDNKSECYKLFWFQTIVDFICRGQDIVSYEEVVDKMIADAWYMVTEYHLNLGPKDYLEKAVQRLERISKMKSSEKKEVVYEVIKNCDDQELMRMKRILILNVPYRLQAPFLQSMKGTDWNVRPAVLAERINKEKHLLYYFQEFHGLHTRIQIQPEWSAYIRKNAEIVKGWIEFHMISYLQKRNPSVPGIIDKLYPPRERHLEKVKKYWKVIMSLTDVYEIYGKTRMEQKDISIDHFVPWSYVASDELWNLHPTTKRINSSKSNRLPEWKLYFPALSKLEYQSYLLMWKYEKVHAEFDQCAREHLNNQEIRGRLYKEGLKEEEFTRQLETVLLPVYQSAQNAGFSKWKFQS